MINELNLTRCGANQSRIPFSRIIVIYKDNVIISIESDEVYNIHCQSFNERNTIYDLLVKNWNDCLLRNDEKSYIDGILSWLKDLTKDHLQKSTSYSIFGHGDDDH